MYNLASVLTNTRISWSVNYEKASVGASGLMKEEQAFPGLGSEGVSPKRGHAVRGQAALPRPHPPPETPSGPTADAYGRNSWSVLGELTLKTSGLALLLALAS